MAATRTPPIARRWPRAGRGQKPLLGATAMVIAGAFMPWVNTAFGNVMGVRGAGLWTFYAGMLGLAGALISFRRLAAGQAIVMAAAATLLPLWQVVHLLSKVGLQGWMPGPGLVLTFGGGVLAWVAARSLLRGEDAPPGQRR